MERGAEGCEYAVCRGPGETISQERQAERHEHRAGLNAVGTAETIIGGSGDTRQLSVIRRRIKTGRLRCLRTRRAVECAETRTAQVDGHQRQQHDGRETGGATSK